MNAAQTRWQACRYDTSPYEYAQLDPTVNSSVSRGVPLRFTLGVGMVIRGWDEGLLCMQEGGKALLVCPPDYAYGEGGMPPVIPPSATLLFDVELIKVHPRGRGGGLQCRNCALRDLLNTSGVSLGNRNAAL